MAKNGENYILGKSAPPPSPLSLSVTGDHEGCSIIEQNAGLKLFTVLERRKYFEKRNSSGKTVEVEVGKYYLTFLKILVWGSVLVFVLYFCHHHHRKMDVDDDNS